MKNLNKLREFCLAFPGVSEEYPWEHVVWKVGGKIFAITSDPAENVTVMSTLDRQAALILDPAIQIASHVGRFGWVTISLESDELVEVSLALIQDSYDQVLSKLSKKKQLAIRQQPNSAAKIDP